MVVSVVAPGRVRSSAIMPGAGPPAVRRDRRPSALTAGPAAAKYPAGYRDLWAARHFARRRSLGEGPRTLRASGFIEKTEGAQLLFI